MKNIIIRLITIVFIAVNLSGCQSVNPKIFKPQENMMRTIVPIELHIIDPNIKYKNNKKMVNIVHDKRIEEARYIIYREFHQNVFEPMDTMYGYAYLQVKRKASINYVLAALSVLTLTTINIIGFPATWQHAEIELDLEILDSQRQSISHYTVKGGDTEYSALLWGYNYYGSANVKANIPISQVVNTKALQKALAALKIELEKDVTHINETLMAAGPIPFR